MSEKATSTSQLEERAVKAYVAAERSGVSAAEKAWDAGELLWQVREYLRDVKADWASKSRAVKQSHKEHKPQSWREWQEARKLNRSSVDRYIKVYLDSGKSKARIKGKTIGEVFYVQAPPIEEPLIAGDRIILLNQITLRDEHEKMFAYQGRTWFEIKGLNKGGEYLAVSITDDHYGVPILIPEQSIRYFELPKPSQKPPRRKTAAAAPADTKTAATPADTKTAATPADTKTAAKTSKPVLDDYVDEKDEVVSQFPVDLMMVIASLQRAGSGLANFLQTQNRRLRDDESQMIAQALSDFVAIFNEGKPRTAKTARTATKTETKKPAKTAKTATKTETKKPAA